MLTTTDCPWEAFMARHASEPLPPANEYGVCKGRAKHAGDVTAEVRHIPGAPTVTLHLFRYGERVHVGEYGTPIEALLSARGLADAMTAGRR